jgi:hypothetical protein
MLWFIYLLFYFDYSTFLFLLEPILVIYNDVFVLKELRDYDVFHTGC